MAELKGRGMGEIASTGNVPALSKAVQPFCSRSLCQRAATLVTPASVRGMGQSEAECLIKDKTTKIL